MGLTDKRINFWRGFKEDYENLDSINPDAVYFIVSENDDIGEIRINDKLVANISNNSIGGGDIDGGNADNLKTKIQLRGDTKNNWESASPPIILAERELVVETDSNMMKIGDGITPYSELEYISGGGSGGGSSRPIIESDFNTSYVRTDENVVLEYFLSSPNYGLCKAYYFIDNAMTTINPISVEQGSNKWNVGVLSKGEHILKLYIIDSGNLYSNTLTFKVTSGSLELISSYSDADQYEPIDDVIIDFYIDSVFKNRKIKLTRKVSYGILTETLEDEYVGSQGVFWNIKDIINGRLGVFKVSIEAETVEEDEMVKPITSNTLNYTIIVGSGNSLFISTDIADGTVYTNDDIISLPFRISMKGVNYFKTEVTINGIKSTLNTKYGTNYWQVGKRSVGTYNLSIKSFTEDYKVESNELNFTLEVIQASDINVDPTPQELMYLIGWFDASEMSNDYPSSQDGGTGPFRDKWTDKTGKGMDLSLMDVGYTNVNGWVNNSLKLNGESYAVIDYQPLANNAPNGLCIDITYRTENVGEESARVLSCESDEGYGIHIQPSQANITSSKRDLITYFSENTWTRMTLIINRSERLMYTYINGTFTDVSNIDDTSTDLDNFMTDSKIYLNCRMFKGDATDFGSCEIKNIRIYSRPIEANTVVRNFIYDIEDTEEKKHVYRMNYEQAYALPVLRVIGDLSEMTKDTRVVVTAVYDGKGGEFGEPFELDSCQLSWQGTSSLVYPVKNLKIRLGYMNSLGVREKYKYSPLVTWNSESTFTLKTDYMESGHTNNTGTAKIVNDMYTEKTPPQYLDPNARTAIDGFPIAMYNDKPDGKGGVESEYMGVFMFNIDKGADSCFGFDRKKWPNNLSYEISANSDIGAGAFRTDDDESVSRELEIRYPDEADTWTDHSKIRRLITWVKNSTDAEFKADFEKYLNKEYTIKYFVMVLSLGMIDSLGKNMMMNTWDGLIWFPSFYDMDTMLGLDNTGQIRIPVSAEMKAGEWNTSNSLLWTKLQKNFDKEIKELYYSLRKEGSKLHYDELMKVYEGEIVNNIAQKYYNDDAYTKYINNTEGRAKYLYACHGSRIEYTKKWIKERLLFMDSLMGYTGSDVHIECSFRANKQGKVILRLKTYTPMYVTVNFAATTGAQLTYLCGPNDYTEYEWTLLTATDQEINITGAPHLKEIDGLKDFRPSTILFERATKLTTIDCSESQFLKQASLNGMTNLRYVNFSNCVNLGTLTGGDTVINVSSCPNLKTLLLPNTQITGVTLLNGGGYKTIDISNTKLREFKIDSMAYLDTIGISGCMYLDTVDISNCNKIINLNMSGNKATKVNINRCRGIENINLNNNSGLSLLNINNCPNLSKLSLGTISNKEFKVVNIEGCKSIEELNIVDSKYIETIIFDAYDGEDEYGILKRLDASGSGLINFKYGSNDSSSTDVNFLKLPLMNYVKFNYCENLKSISNLNIADNGYANFFRCINLESVTGEIKLEGDIGGLFYYCSKLMQYPIMDLSEVTSARSAFAYNPYMSNTFCYDIMRSFSEKITDITELFYSNRNIYEIYSDMFVNTPNISNMTNAFRSTQISNIPAGLLDPLGENLNIVTGAFGYTQISHIPEDLFAKAIYLTNSANCFENCSLLVEIPQNIFKYNTYLTNISKCFANCSSARIVLNRDFMSNISSVLTTSNAFENCNNLIGGGVNGELTSDVFDDNINFMYINSMLRGCSSLTGQIPSGLFKNCKNVNDISYFFEGCYGLTGEIPEDLINDISTEDGLSQLNTCNNILAGCYNLTGSIPGRFFEKSNSLINISASFMGCSKLTGSIPENLLSNLISLIQADNLFRECILISGSIPEKIFEKNTNLRSVNGAFYRCISLGGSIPEKIFEKNINLSQASELFAYSTNIEGSIPTLLFSNNTTLQSLNSAFKGCTGLKNSSESSYFVDELFLEKNINLTDIGGMFSDTKFTGSIPTLLFRNLRGLDNISELFYNTIGIDGVITTSMFQNCSSLKNVNRAFAYTGISNIGTDSDAVFKMSNNPNIEYFEEAFMSCSNLEYAPKLWDSYLDAKASGCFANCNAASNYPNIPTTWK